jgi:hypothetical protein
MMIVYLTNNIMEITTLPDKFSDEITISISTETEDHCIVVLENQAGRILRMMGINLISGNNQIRVDNVNSLEPGVYQLCIKNTQSNILHRSLITKF